MIGGDLMKLYRIYRHASGIKNAVSFIRAKDKKSALKKAKAIYGYRFEYTFNKI